MNLLALETSSSILSVAVKRQGGQTVQKEVAGFLSHVENLVPSMDELLESQKLKLQDMDAFLIGRGPGSFTGLRVGFATLKALQIVQKKDCYGVLSLDMIAENIEDAKEGENLAVCLDARREKMYLRLYRKDSRCWNPLDKIEVLDWRQSLEHLPQGAWVTGDALSKYAQEFKKAAQGKNLSLIPEEKSYPRASKLIELFERCDSKVQTLTTPADFVPLYFRLSEAEERMK